MPAFNTQEAEAIDYRYFVCDLSTNELLAEIPFKSVSYSRSLTEAGTFTGDIAITEDTFNLNIYENTMPGNTALYVVRNGICVWGGIIWGRTYSLIDRVASISASEFTSYLSHRVVWKTYNSTYQASAVVENGVATITLDFGQYGFTVGETVWIDWGQDLALYTGYFVVDTVGLTDDDRSVITVEAKYSSASNPENLITIPDQVVDELLSVETRQDTYNYARDLMRELNTDLFDFDFANDAIRPGIDLFNEISVIARQGGVARATTTRKHELVEGQRIDITDVGGGFDVFEGTVKEVLGERSFTYDNATDLDGNSLPDTGDLAVTDTTVTIESFSRQGNVETFTTSGAHDFGDQDIVFIQDVSRTFDGYRVVYGDPESNTQFQTVNIGPDIALSFTDTESGNPIAKRRGALTYGSFGEHTTKGDIGFDFNENPDFSGNLEANPVIRGYELKTVAEVLEEYSTKPNGFEYRVDCEYDSTTNTFKKYFKFIPLIPTSLTDYLEQQGTGFTGAIPPSAYGADEIFFEYPGNVLEANFEENAEDAATRFFVQGKDSRLSNDASQPYSGASNHKLLNRGWPILDAVDDLDSADETVLWKQAARLLDESVPPISTFSISVNGSANPVLGTYNPGDWCSIKLNDNFVDLRAASYLEQDYGASSGALVRKIVSFDVSVPDTPNFPEEVSLELVVEPSIPISGVQVIDGRAYNGN